MLPSVESLFGDETAPVAPPPPVDVVPPEPYPSPLVPSPPPAVPPSARQSAGVGVLLAVAGTSVGYLLGGLRGAGAGLLLIGATRNTLRASRGWTDPDPAVRRDAGTSASLALFGVLVGGYLAYSARSERAGAAE